MRDYHFFMCTTPHGEHCAQVGSPDYQENARAEADAFINQLQRVYGEEPSGAYFKVVECTHDFGIYLDIRFNFDDEIQAHLAYLEQIEDGIEHWDEIAKQRLAQAGYRAEQFRMKVSHRAA